MEKKYKVESKGSLWEVSLESGHYSDWDIDHYIFSGNSAEEVWEFVKIWAKDGGATTDVYSGKVAMVWGENKYQFTDVLFGKKIEDEDINWEDGYGHAYEVNIKRADVIYINP